MEKLFEHTLHRQVAEQSKEIGELKDQIAELTALMKGGTLSTTTNNSNNSNNSNNTNNGMQLIQNNSQTTININPWGGALWISSEMLEKLFEENETLQRSARIGPGKMDEKELAECVQELFIGLVKKVHSDPRERNVYLNPKRSDQVLVYDKETWAMLTLAEAVRSLFDRISNRLTILTSPLAGSEWQKLVPGVRDSTACSNTEYIRNRENHSTKANGSLAAHMGNITPGHQRLALPAPAAKNKARHQQPQKEAKPAKASEQSAAEKKVSAPPTKNEARPQQRQKEVEEEPKEAKTTKMSEQPVAAKKAAAPPPFTAYDAAGLLRATKRARGESHASYAKRLFEGAKGQDPGRVMTKLWEAQEEGLLSEVEAMYVRELVSKHDEGALA